MRVSAAEQAKYNISTKSLYFTKSPIITLNKAVELLPQENNAITSNGIRYLKDNDISKKLQQRFADCSFIKKLSDKYDIFVWFATKKTHKDFCSWAKIMQVENGDTIVNTNYYIGKSNYAQNVATDNLFEQLKNNGFVVL